MQEKSLPGSSLPSRRRANSGYVEEWSLALPLDRNPMLPPPYDSAVLAAVKAVAEGRAESYQQRLAMQWVVAAACGAYENPYRPGVEGARDTEFACGKQFVGQQIVKLINMPMKNADQGEQG